jgi:hypothetical protein
MQMQGADFARLLIRATKWPSSTIGGGFTDGGDAALSRIFFGLFEF